MAIGWCRAGHPHDPVKGCRICWLLRHEGNVDHTHHASAAGVEANYDVYGTPMGDARWRRGAAMSTWGNDREGASAYEFRATLEECLRHIGGGPFGPWFAAAGIDATLAADELAFDIVVEPSNADANVLVMMVVNERRLLATVEVSPSMDPDPLVCGVGTLASWRIGVNHGIPMWPSNRAMMCAHADRQVGRTVPPILRPAYDGEGYPLKEPMRGSSIVVAVNGERVMAVFAPSGQQSVGLARRQEVLRVLQVGSIIESPITPTITVARAGTYLIQLNVDGGANYSARLSVQQLSDDVTSPTA